VQVEDQATRAIYVRLRHRARTLRGLAIGFVALIALTLAFGAIPYFLAGDMAVTETRAALEMRRAEAEHAKGVEKRERRGEPVGEAAAADALPAASGDAAPLIAEAQAGPAGGAAPALRSGVGDEVFAAAVIRITDVVLLVALVFIFGSLYRYSMRLAAYYDEKADALRLLEAGDRQVEERLSQIPIPLERKSEPPVPPDEQHG
jgi:hypothetical protein